MNPSRPDTRPAAGQSTALGSGLEVARSRGHLSARCAVAARWIAGLVALVVLVSTLPWELSLGIPSPRVHRGLAAEHGTHRSPHDQDHTGEHTPCDDGCLCPIGGGLALTPPELTETLDYTLTPMLEEPCSPPRVLGSQDVPRRIDHPPRAV